MGGNSNLRTTPGCLVRTKYQTRSFAFTTDLAKGIEEAQIIFSCLPTPPGEDGSADLKYVLQVADQLGHLIRDYKIVINKSTVPVGTAERVRDVIAKNCKTEFDVISNPEFLREGLLLMISWKSRIGSWSVRILKEQKNHERTLCTFRAPGNPIYFMDERSAELTKYAANAFLATKISFMNEIANLCEKTRLM